VKAKAGAKTTESPSRPGRGGPGLAVLAGTSAALVAVVFVLLAQRVAAGADPVLSAVRHAAPRPVIVRRIVRRVVVDTTIHTRGRAAPVHASESASPIVTSQSGGEAPAPVTRSS